jgi:hypothetical protein
MFGSGWKVRSAGVGIVGLIVSGTLGGLGVAGALPAPAQSSLAAVAHAVGIDLITPDSGSRADRRADRPTLTASTGLDDTASSKSVSESSTSTTMLQSEVAAEQATEAAHQSASATAVKSSSSGKSGNRGRNGHGGSSDSASASSSSATEAQHQAELEKEHAAEMEAQHQAELEKEHAAEMEAEHQAELAAEHAAGDVSGRHSGASTTSGGSGGRGR